MDKHQIVTALADRGHFAGLIGRAWFQADLTNRHKIEVAFEHLFKEVDPTFVAAAPSKRTRFADADDIYNGGACNPVAVSNALARAIKAASDEGNGHDAVKEDGAVKMILDHLCFLCGMPQPSFRIDGWEDTVRKVVAQRIELEGALVAVDSELMALIKDAHTDSGAPGDVYVAWLRAGQQGIYRVRKQYGEDTHTFDVLPDKSVAVSPVWMVGDDRQAAQGRSNPVEVK